MSEDKSTLKIDNFIGTAKGAIAILNAMIATIQKGDETRRIQLKLTVKEL
jgi:hypothetical protein